MVGPMIGATMMPAPQSAIAWPCRSRGLMSMITDCESGASAAPKAPCRMRKSTISSRLKAVPQSAEDADEADDADDEQALAADIVGEPAGDRRRDRRGDDIGGEHPGDGVLRRAEARLHVRQRDVGDGRVEDLHDHRDHHRDGDEAAMLDLDEAPAPAAPLIVSRAWRASPPAPREPAVAPGSWCRRSTEALRPRAERQVVDRLVETDADRHALHDLDPVAGRVLRGKDGELGAGAGADAGDLALVACGRDRRRS